MQMKKTAKHGAALAVGKGFCCNIPKSLSGIAQFGGACNV